MHVAFVQQMVDRKGDAAAAKILRHRQGAVAAHLRSAKAASPVMSAQEPLPTGMPICTIRPMIGVVPVSPSRSAAMVT